MTLGHPPARIEVRTPNRIALNLPPHINAAGLIPFLGMLRGGDEFDQISINFAELRRVSPAGLAALTATINRWCAERKQVLFAGLNECPITAYLQRMDFFRACDHVIPESFERHESKGRFVAVQRVDCPVEDMGKAMALCAAPGGDDFGHPMAALYDFLFYVLTETGNNVRQHSGGIGYATAQVTLGEGFVRMAIADNGRGIRQSFIDAGLPWAPGLSHADAIVKALEPRISSKGNPTNEGVGLTLTRNLAVLARAWMLIVSGNGSVQVNPGGDVEVGELPVGGHYQGTLLAITFKQNDIGEFYAILQEAKLRAGLLQPPQYSPRFAL